MANMNWAELLDFADFMFTSKGENLKQIPVKIYDALNQQEMNCDIVEIKNEDGSWTPYIGINLEEAEIEAE